MWLLLWVQAKLASESTGKHMHVCVGDVTIFEGAAQFQLYSQQPWRCGVAASVCFALGSGAHGNRMCFHHICQLRGVRPPEAGLRSGVLPVCRASQPDASVHVFVSTSLLLCLCQRAIWQGLSPQMLVYSCVGTTTHFAFAPMDTTSCAPRTSARICLNATHVTQACVSCRAVDNRHCFGHNKLCVVLHLGLRSAQSTTFVCACCVQYHGRAQYYGCYAVALHPAQCQSCCCT